MKASQKPKRLTFTNKAMAAKNNVDKGLPCQTSSSDKNAHIENLKLSLSTDNNNLPCSALTSLKGLYKTDAQRHLILYEDFYEEERKAFNEDKSLIESLENGKKSTKSVDEVKSAFADARKKQKDQFYRMRQKIGLTRMLLI